jgi:hypothetical protein
MVTRLCEHGCVAKVMQSLIKHHAKKTYEGMEEYIHAFLSMAPDGGKLSTSRSGRFTVGKITPVRVWIRDRCLL